MADQQAPHAWQAGQWTYPYSAALAAWPPAAWPPGFVPWGYVSAPPVASVFEPPGNFHPIWRRSLLSLRGRASPRLYRLGLILGVPGFVALLVLWIGARSGLSFAGTPIPALVLVEAVSIVAAVGLSGAALAQAHQRMADGWKDYAGPAPLLAAGALLALIACLSLPLEYGLSAAGILPGVAGSTLLQVLLYLATYVGVVHVLAVRTGASKTPELVDAWGRPVGRWRSRIARGFIGDILWALVLLLPLFFVSAILSALLAVALGLHAGDISSPVTTTVTTLDRWITILAVAVIVPIGEEIFYRGFATNGWGRSLGRNSALLRAALLFAAIHIINVTTTEAGLSLRAAVFNMSVRIPVAIALTWIYMRRRSLIASATLHGSYNGLIVIIGILATY